jgi:hypothetical protein
MHANKSGKREKNVRKELKIWEGANENKSRKRRRSERYKILCEMRRMQKATTAGADGKYEIVCGVVRHLGQGVT